MGGPPAGLAAFYWHFVRQTKGWYAAMFAASLAVAALDTVTGAPTAWNPNPDIDLIALAVSGGTVYAGGWFTTIGGQVLLGEATYLMKDVIVDQIDGVGWPPLRELLPKVIENGTPIHV